MKPILNILKPHKNVAIIILSISLFSAAFEAVGIAMVLPLLTTIVNNDSSEIYLNEWIEKLVIFFDNSFGFDNQIIILISLILILFFLKNLMIYVRSISVVYFQNHIRADVSTKLMKKYLDIPLTEFNKEEPGKLINNLVTESTIIGKFFAVSNNFLSRIFIIVAIYIVLLFTDFELTFYLSIIIVVLLLVFRSVVKSTIELIGRNRLRYSQIITDESQQAIKAIRDIRLFNLKLITLYNFSSSHNNLKKILVKLSFIKDLPAPLFEILIILTLSVSIFYVELFSQKSLSEFIPSIAFLGLALQRIASNLSLAVSESVFFSAYMPSLNLVDSILNNNLQSNKHLSIEKNNYLGPVDELSIKNISFSFDSNFEILKNVSLNIKKNTITAIVGKSGSGKSTLIDLLCVFYKPETGEITDYQNNINNYEKDEWRSKLSVVSNNSFFFPGTIRQNIILANDKASSEKINQALDISQSYQFVNKLKNGLDTQIGLDGASLSTGQFQRLAIARAIIKDCSLLILDEATSNIDNNNEKMLIEKLVELKKEKTILMVTHNLKNLKVADYIYFLDEGKIIGEGKPDEVKNLIDKL